MSSQEAASNVNSEFRVEIGVKVSHLHALSVTSARIPTEASRTGGWAAESEPTVDSTEARPPFSPCVPELRPPAETLLLIYIFMDNLPPRLTCQREEIDIKMGNQCKDPLRPRRTTINNHRETPLSLSPAKNRRMRCSEEVLPGFGGPNPRGQMAWRHGRFLRSWQVVVMSSSSFRSAANRS